MEAVRRDGDWPLVFPSAASPGAEPGADVLQRAWSGSGTPVSCRVYRVVRARELWRRICDAAFDAAEPGVLFVDRINASNNLAYCELLSATNPCGEQPLPPYGACNLGSLNLTAFVVDPFSAAARFDHHALREAASYAVRFLDDVIEISRFPLPRQREQVLRARRIGLGITGLADALAMLGLRYDDEAARTAAAGVMRAIRDAAYAASIALARRRGPFPAFDADRYASQPFVRSLPEPLQRAIRDGGIRNSHLLSIAPTGTISLLANNVSSGIEPIFALEARRRALERDGRTWRSFDTTDFAYATWRAGASKGAEPPACLADREAIAPRDHLRMQAALQPCVDGAISKTITLPAHCSRADVAEIYESAYRLGLKGCTVFHASARPGVLTDRRDAGSCAAIPAATECCEPATDPLPTQR
jgi:ribonucleoside-diphosphate reductase alpha chain